MCEPLDGQYKPMKRGNGSGLCFFFVVVENASKQKACAGQGIEEAVFKPLNTKRIARCLGGCSFTRYRKHGLSSTIWGRVNWGRGWYVDFFFYEQANGNSSKGYVFQRKGIFHGTEQPAKAVWTKAISTCCTGRSC